MSRKQPIVHLCGSIPLPDAETVFRAVIAACGPHVTRIPDGETGVRKTWIRFLMDIMTSNPAIERANVPPFRFVQWDGKLLREFARHQVKPGMTLDPATIKTGYTDMALESYAVFERLQKAGVIPAGVKFQFCLPTSIAPTYNNMIPADRQKVIPAFTEALIGNAERIARVIPNVAIQWDVCQEVLAWEGYFEPGPVDVRKETIDVVVEMGNRTPASAELGFHLCYGSPNDEHLVQPKDAGIMVEMVNAIAARVKRPIQFFHLPVPKPRTDDAFYAPLKGLKLGPGTELYLGLIHYDDEAGNAARLAAARRYVRVDGVATECGWGRSDPARVPSLLAAHTKAIAA